MYSRHRLQTDTQGQNDTLLKHHLQTPKVSMMYSRHRLQTDTQGQYLVQTLTVSITYSRHHLQTDTRGQLTYFTETPSAERPLRSIWCTDTQN